MVCWIRGNSYLHEHDQFFNSIEDARRTAIKMLESGKTKAQNVPIYKSQYGNALYGNVFKEKGGKFSYSTYDSKYGAQSYGLYKNGKLIR